ncbi:MAG: hypothetical protein K1X75_02905 [Leptospirales bacterium]|nr:hypothetical protein [Leptospirales bacterium]
MKCKAKVIAIVLQLLISACQSATLSNQDNAPALGALQPGALPVALRNPAIQLRVAECRSLARLRIQGSNFWADPGRAILAVTVIFEANSARPFDIEPFTLMAGYSGSNPDTPGQDAANQLIAPELIILVAPDGSQQIARQARDATARVAPGAWLARRYLWSHRIGAPPDLLKLSFGPGAAAPVALRNCSGS